MPNVYPEELNRGGDENLRGTVEKLESYIRYMCERSDFAITTLERKVNALEKRLAALETE